MPPVLPWGSITLLHNVVTTLHHLHQRNQEPLPRVVYRAKVKLHGTNAAVQCRAEGVFPQSRTQLLRPESDNKGFARWVASHLPYFAALPPGVTLFGEWCGPGVERGVAVSSLPRKVFAVFALQYEDAAGPWLEVEPARIREVLPPHPDVFVLPWHGEPLAFAFADDFSSATEALNRAVAEVEREDPWVKAEFGISGVGEGLVLYPVEEAPLRPERFSLLAIKAKGEQHRTAATKHAAQAAPERVAGVAEFVALLVTEARLQQGLSEVCGGTAALSQMGAFVRWVGEDVKKESVAEREAAGLRWEDLSSAVTARAREWLKARAGR